MSAGFLARWRRRRECFHHDHVTGQTWITGRLIDLGRRKIHACQRCERVWIA